MDKVKIKKPLQKYERGVSEQSSHTGIANPDTRLLVSPLNFLFPDQPIPIEPEGLRMEPAAEVEPSPGKAIGLQETDSSLVGQKIGPKILAKDIHLRLTKKGFKIHKIVNPFFDKGEGEEKSEGEEGRDTPGQTSKPTNTTIEVAASQSKSTELPGKAKTTGTSVPLMSPAKPTRFTEFAS